MRWFSGVDGLRQFVLELFFMCFFCVFSFPSKPVKIFVLTFDAKTKILFHSNLKQDSFFGNKRRTCRFRGVSKGSGQIHEQIDTKQYINMYISICLFIYMYMCIYVYMCICI